MTKILVIEDERAILENVVETLELEGFDVRGAQNGRAGVEIAQSYLPDLIICDIMMPELNGYGVLLQLRERPETANIPLMFLTAKADRADMRKGMELGADDYLIKPFTASELLAAVGARIERRISITKEYEQKINNLRGNIICALPHELRTPLTGIIGYSEILLMDFKSLEPDQVYNMVEAIYRSGMRLYHLIENYLIYAQIELMMTDPKRIAEARSAPPLETNSVIAAVVQNKAAEAERAGDLEMHLCNAEVRIYTQSLEKITGELLDNAFKFSTPGSTVRVETSKQNGYFVLQISDSGRGMTAEQIANVGAYMQFERAVYEQQGLGLGLIIARRLAELHGGQLNVQSAPGQGTTISVQLMI
ncbi:MAG: response regulator [Chloroflexi bacterium]|nr:response regulator [Chloroflexota bacterium]